MSLYQVLNNEAADEDNKINREVLARLKKNYIDNKEQAKPNLLLDGVQKSVLKKNFSNFDRQLYNLIGYVEQKRLSNRPFNIKDLTELISNIIQSFNTLVIFIGTVNYEKLFQSDKTFIDNKMLEYLPIINLIEEQLKDEIDSTLLLPISSIKDNIKFKLYNIVSYGIQDIAENEGNKLKQIKDKRTREKENLILKYLQNYNSKAKIRTLPAAQTLELVKKLTGKIVKTKGQALTILFEQLKKYNDIVDDRMRQPVAEEEPEKEPEEPLAEEPEQARVPIEELGEEVPIDIDF